MSMVVTHSAISGDDLIIGANITQLPPPAANRGLSVPSGVGNTQGSAFVFRGVASTPTAADGNISGHIADVIGDPMAGVTVRLSGTQNRLVVTDALGNYRFDNVETNGFYTVTPLLANFIFSPSQRSFSPQSGRMIVAQQFTAGANS
jgi:hypothetical protein